MARRSWRRCSSERSTSRLDGVETRVLAEVLCATSPGLKHRAATPAEYRDRMDLARRLAQGNVRGVARRESLPERGEAMTLLMTFAGALATLGSLGLIGAASVYVADRVSALLGVQRRWPARIALLIVMAGAIAAMLGAAKFDGAIIGALNILGGYLINFLLFLLIALLCLHAIELRWRPPRLWSLVAVLLVALAVTVIGAWRGSGFTVVEREIPLPGLERDLSLMLISDVHLGHQRGRAYLEKIVAETNRRRPDLVLITGDLLDAEAALTPGVLSPLAALEAPTYFVGGNHEKYVDGQRAAEAVARQGVHVLHNEVIEAMGVQIVGLDYMRADEETFDMHPSNDRRTIASVLAETRLRRDLPSILMHHSPVGVRHVAGAGIDLMLAGHTHAGQLFPFTALAKLIFPFNSGLYRVGQTRIFVSPGAGTFMPRVRLGSSNEINLLRLRPER